MAPPVELYVEAPLNIGEYQQIAMAVLSELYIGFPSNHTVIDPTKVAKIIGIGLAKARRLAERTSAVLVPRWVPDRDRF
jgi:hypothetical protein